MSFRESLIIATPFYTIFSHLSTEAGITIGMCTFSLQHGCPACSHSMRVSGFWCTEGLSIHGKLAQGLPFKTEGGICALNRIGFGVGNAFPYRVMGIAFRAAFCLFLQRPVLTARSTIALPLPEEGIQAKENPNPTSPGGKTGFGTPEGTRYIKELPPSSWRQSTAHWAVELNCSSPFVSAYQKSRYPNGISVSWVPEGTRNTKVSASSSRRRASVHRTLAFNFSSPFLSG